ncbi:MAG: 4-alpha-glucanotransferase [Myxococcota bacterium]
MTTRARGRCSGVLLHVTSLPGGPSSGDLGRSAYEFADFLVKAGQTRWQTLPLNPIGEGSSPYSSASSFAGEPLMISPERLVEEGLLEGRELEGVAVASSDWRCSFQESRALREGLLSVAYRRFVDRPRGTLLDAYDEFRAREKGWLDDYCLFGALTQRFGTRRWTSWPLAMARGESEPLRQARDELAAQIDYLAFQQFVFDRQWRALHDYCRARGIAIIGDMPMFVAHDSCDVWANRRGFLLDDDGQPEFVSGAPPDAFAAEGQRWNNPLYDWPYQNETGFSWWTRRIERQLALFDVLRLDHFIGFSRYWRIARDAKSAKDGQWIPVPGRAFFDQLSRTHGDLPLIAEDLGAVSEEVWELRDRYRFPGMKVLQFAFSNEGSAAVHLPDHYPKSSVAFTGTHDSDTTRGWYQALREQHDRGEQGASDELHRAHLWLGTGEEPEIVPAAMWKLSESLADTVIFPMQDVLNLDGSHRMNAPGTAEGNWTWRLKSGELDDSVSKRLREIAETTGRSPALRW